MHIMIRLPHMFLTRFHEVHAWIYWHVLFLLWGSKIIIILHIMFVTHLFVKISFTRSKSLRLVLFISVIVGTKKVVILVLDLWLFEILKAHIVEISLVIILFWRPIIIILIASKSSIFPIMTLFFMLK